MFRPRYLLAVVLALLVLIVVVQNSEVVELRLLVWEFSIPRVILILLAATTGFVCGYVVARITETRRESPPPQ